MRDVAIEDYQFVAECYADWPIDNRGPFTLQRAIDSCRRWVARDDEFCLILEGPDPVGLITYRIYPPTIDNIVTHPDVRGVGHATRMMRELQAFLGPLGLDWEFDALPGPIADKVLRGDFEKVSEGVGPKTGLPTVRGRVMADTEI